VSVGDSAPVSTSTPQEAPKEVKEEKLAFDVELVSVDAAAKLKLIKEVRTLLNLGLKEVKGL